MKRYIYPLLFFLLVACHKLPDHPEAVPSNPIISPDYINVTVPENIAPLNFQIEVSETNAVLEEAIAVVSALDKELMRVSSSDGFIRFPLGKWKSALQTAVNGSLDIKVYTKVSGVWSVYQPFPIYVSADRIDPYMAYRLIEPGCQIWNKMGIYQRNLESFEQTAILENKTTDFNCMNCHSFCMQNPHQFMFHTRAGNKGTMIVDGDSMEKLEAHAGDNKSPLVYPSWHPSGRFITFSINEIGQSFHLNDPNCIEVFDKLSDVVVYDVEKHEVISSDLLSSPSRFETFPTFSPDGRTLYFCSAEARPIPERFTEVKYSLCSLSFDPVSRSFGSVVDTVYNAREAGKSVSFPRVSPDGNYIMFTLASYGNFSIWHKDADLCLYDLNKREYVPMKQVNSNDVESYHSWSSNSRWFVFSSRRINGRFTSPFFAHVSSDGKVGKPFLLPQDRKNFYLEFAKSYNIPELIKGKVEVSQFDLKRLVKGEAVPVREAR